MRRPNATTPRVISAQEWEGLPAFKRCAKCLHTLPRDAFTWYRHRRPNGHLDLALKPRCKACVKADYHALMADPLVARMLRAQDLSYYWKHRERRRAHDLDRNRAKRRRAQEHLIAAYFAVVCREYGVTRESICGPSRAPDLLQPRKVLAYVLTTDVLLDLSEVGRLLHRDRTTVLHHRDTMRRYMNWEEREMVRAVKIACGRFRGYRGAIAARQQRAALAQRAS